jgi:hypothetical protein
MDALIRAGGREALILSDVNGVKMALGELGARRVGKDYDVEPLKVDRGIFHPKVNVLASENDCHVMVGSGNLTFGGWGQNCEVVEHLHPSFAADAIADTADFFEILALSDNVSHGAVDQCGAISEELRSSVSGHSMSGDIRMIHSLDGSIADRLVGEADALGGATRLIVASPFWDNGAAIDRLCSRLEIEDVAVHAHPGGTVQGKAGSNWPFKSEAHVRPVTLDLFGGEDARPLHAKMFEVICNRGRLILSGSANATTAALGENFNVETCVLRIQRNTLVGWSMTDATVPDPTPQSDDSIEDEDVKTGVLRASLDGDRVVGQVLTPAMSGEVSVWQLTSSGSEKINTTNLEDSGEFIFESRGLEVLGWQNERITLRVEDSDGRAAEGFVSIIAFRSVMQRSGAIALRLFAVLAGTETPKDVAAIMSWFQENPDVLSERKFVHGTGHGEPSSPAQEDSSTILVSDLGSDLTLGMHEAGMATNSAPSASWHRFMDNIHAAFRQNRGPQTIAMATKPASESREIEEELEDADTTVSSIDAEPAFMEFEKLLEELLANGKPQWHPLIAFDLCHYVCDRLRPDRDRAQSWLNRIIRGLSGVQLPQSHQANVYAAVIVDAAAWQGENRARNARAKFLTLGMTHFENRPDVREVSGYAGLLTPIVPYEELWAAIKEVRTVSEQRCAYLHALSDTSVSKDSYSELSTIAKEEWDTLERALTDPKIRDRLLLPTSLEESCPKCFIKLPSGEFSKLSAIGIAKSKNCCGRVIVLDDEGRADD